jgi:small ligand-binding sensory domain FIST
VARFAAALSEEPDTDKALAQVIDRALQQLDGTPDLAMLFFSASHADRAEHLAAEGCRRLGTERLFGGSGESIVGEGREIEWAPALALWLARLPEVQLTPIHLTFASTPDGGSILGWPDALVDRWPDKLSLLAIGEPFSFPADFFLERINREHPGTTVIGGMASGGSQPGECRLLFGPKSLSEGAVVLALEGDLPLRTVVSQGCRPIGRPYVVTRAERNIILELGGQPALTRLQETFEELPNREKLLVQRGLHLGRVVSEYQEHFEVGDFLVRNVVGADERSGAIAIGDYIRTGQTVQFHVRDQQTADDEMRQLLQGARLDLPDPAAALLFTCNGRGTRLFPGKDHDARLLQEVCGPIPLAGFFAQGEMGPVGGQNFLHGFTASAVLFG